MKTAKELLDYIDKKEQEIKQAEQEMNSAFNQLENLHGKKFEVNGEQRLIVKRVSREGPVRYHFRNLGKGAVKVEGREK